MAEHDEQDLAAVEADEQQWLTPGVAGVGASSFFSDSGHEITTAVLPSFLTGTLHAGAGALGLIDGASDALIARQAGRRDVQWRGRLARGGYLGTALLGGAIGLAGAVWQVALLRAGSWIARGLRSRPATRCWPPSRPVPATDAPTGWSAPVTMREPWSARCWPP